uniref:Uncharacterized protein n=1 Tax=Anopheles maculatus TaxID=74869 RepID=A0A182SEN9_9DIPT
MCLTDTDPGRYEDLPVMVTRGLLLMIFRASAFTQKTHSAHADYEGLALDGFANVVIVVVPKWLLSWLSSYAALYWIICLPRVRRLQSLDTELHVAHCCGRDTRS